jgi:hypothetical protein
MIDIYHDGKYLVSSLYWNGPWKQIGNEFHLAYVDDEHYAVKVSSPEWVGILGDLTVEIRESCATGSDLLQ